MPVGKRPANSPSGSRTEPGAARRAPLGRPGRRHTRRPVATGLDRIAGSARLLRGRRIGLIANPTAVTRHLLHAVDRLRELPAVRLVALLAPEHGVWANAQDLVEIEDARDPRTGLPVHSLYGPTRVPGPGQLAGLDTVVFDVQDVGSRYYTFVTTMLHAMQACTLHGLRMVVLDRPNPLGGIAIDGNVLEPDYRSFVGPHALPVRHGMTVGELALLLRDELALDLDLHVVPMTGWERAMDFEATGLPWVLPSPNMPTVDTAFVYPGGCLVEGTNLSEGRGTTRPFEIVGAPWLDPWELADRMAGERLPGVRFRPLFFTPTFQKHAGTVCGGVQIHVGDRRVFRAFPTYLLLIHHAYRQNPTAFAWRRPPYEYETEKLPIDILCGTDTIRNHLESGRSPRLMEASWKREAAAFRKRRQRYLLY